MAKGKLPNEHKLDIHIGKRIRKKRIEKGMTQTDVANKIFRTFQQVQKYEKGVNAVKASTLKRLAIVLDVHITYFYEGYDMDKDQSNFEYNDHPPELHKNNQIKNERFYPNPNSLSSNGMMTAPLEVEVKKLLAKKVI